MAFYLNRVKEQIGTDKLVLSIPTHTNIQQRQALKDSAHIAKIDLIDILNEHMAIAKAYAYANSEVIEK